MGRISLRDRIKRGLFLLDGAMGTQLIARGVEIGKCNERLNIDLPDIIFSIHQAYLRAGSDAILTNTFGGSRYALARHSLAEQACRINTTASEIARRAAGEGKYVLGDIGPSGDFLQPLGSLRPEGLREAFVEQATALAEGGVDGFIIETMTALDETVIAIEAVKSVCELPIFVSMAFDKAGSSFRTMMGVDVKSAVSRIASLGVDAIGFNCGKMSLDGYVNLAKEFVFAIETLEKTQVTSHKSRVTILAEPNAGLPQLVDGRAVYSVSPADFAAMAKKIHSAGVNIIGGCCGTGPEHIEKITANLKK